MDQDEVTEGASALHKVVESWHEPVAPGGLAKILAFTSGHPDLVALANGDDPADAKGKELLAQIKAVGSNSLGAQLADALVKVGGYPALAEHWVAAKKRLAKMPSLPPSTIAKMVVPAATQKSHASKAGAQLPTGTPAAPKIPADASKPVLPGLDKPGKGSKYVRTPEGAEYYGQPIGSLITPDMAAKAKAVNSAPEPDQSGGQPLLKVGGKVVGVLPPGAVAYIPSGADKAPEDVSAKYVKTWDGKWYGFMAGAQGPSEIGPTMSKMLDQSVKEGKLKPEPGAKPVINLPGKAVQAPSGGQVSPAKPAPDDVPAKISPAQGQIQVAKPPLQQQPKLPVQAEKPPAPKVTAADVPKGAPAGKTTVGGVEVTGAQLAQAVAVLEQSAGMMVKQPLEAVANPLGAMDYHAVKNQWFKAHGKPTGLPKGKFPAKEAVISALKAALAEMGGKAPEAGSDSGNDSSGPLSPQGPQPVPQEPKPKAAPEQKAPDKPSPAKPESTPDKPSADKAPTQAKADPEAIREAAAKAWASEKAKGVSGTPLNAAFKAAKEAGATQAEAEVVVKKVSVQWFKDQKNLPALSPPAPNKPSPAKEEAKAALKQEIKPLVPAITVPGASVQVPQAGGGKMSVTPADLALAITVLESAGGMMIKQPLAKAGHKMASVDYHAVAKLATDAGFVAKGKFKAKEAFLHQLKTWQKAALAKPEDKPSPTPPAAPQSPAPAPKAATPAPVPLQPPVTSWTDWEGKTVSSPQGPVGLGVKVKDGSVVKVPPGHAVFTLPDADTDGPLWAILRLVDGKPVLIATMAKDPGKKFEVSHADGKPLGTFTKMAEIVAAMPSWPAPGTKPTPVVQGPGKPGYELPHTWSMADRVKAGLPPTLAGPIFDSALYTGDDGMEVWAFVAPASGHTHAILVKDATGQWSQFGWATGAQIQTMDGKPVGSAGGAWAVKAKAAHQVLTAPSVPDPLVDQEAAKALADALKAGTPQAKALGKVLSGPSQHPDSPHLWSEAERKAHNLPGFLGGPVVTQDHGDSVITVFVGGKNTVRQVLARRKTGNPAWVKLAFASESTNGGWDTVGHNTDEDFNLAVMSQVVAQAVKELDFVPPGDPLTWNDRQLRVYAHKHGLDFSPGTPDHVLAQKVKTHQLIAKAPKVASAPAKAPVGTPVAKQDSPELWTDQERLDAGLPAVLGMKLISVTGKGVSDFVGFEDGKWTAILARRKTGNPAWVKAGRVLESGTGSYLAYPADAGPPSSFDTMAKAVDWLGDRHDTDMADLTGVVNPPDSWSANMLRKYVHANGVDVSPWADMAALKAAVTAHQKGGDDTPSGPPWEWTPEQQSDGGFPTMTGPPLDKPSTMGPDYQILPTVEGSYTHVVLREIDGEWKVWGFRGEPVGGKAPFFTPAGVAVGSFATKSAGVASLTSAHAQAGADGIAWIPAAVNAVKAPEIPSGTFFVMPAPEIAGDPGVVKTKLTVGPDGSGLLSSEKSPGSIPLEPGAVKAIMESGYAVDSTGTTVVPHGFVPKEVYFLGVGPVPAAKLAEIKHLYQTKGHEVDFKTKGTMEAVLGTKVSGDMLLGLPKAVGLPVSASGVVKAVLAKVENLVDPDDFAKVSAPKPGKKVAPTVPVTPKPSALSGPGAALFTLDAHGFATPFSGALGVPAYDDQKAARIKAISAQFGGNKVVGKNYSKMSSHQKAQWISAWHKGDMVACFELENSAKPSKLHPGHPDNTGTHKVVWAPAVEGELPSGVLPPGEWSGKDIVPTQAETGNYLVAANMAHPTFLTATQQKQWVQFHQAGNKGKVDQYSLHAKKKADQGDAPVGPAPSWDPDAVVGVPWAAYQEVGSPGTWPGSILDQYLTFYKLPKTGWTGSTENIQTATDHLAGLPVKTTAAPGGSTATPTSVPVAPPAPAKPAPKVLNGPEGTGLDLVEDTSSPQLKGTHQVTVYKDQNGGRWVGKTPNSKQGYLVETEHQAHLVAQAFGFGTAKSHIWTKGGVKSQLQQMFDVEKTLGNADIPKLKTSQLADVAREHLLDWILDNDDTHGHNMVVTKTGRVVGIDKGRSFIGYGHWSGLDLDGGMDSRTHTVYRRLYDAVATGAIDKAEADKIYLAVAIKAEQMAGKPDSVVAERVAAALKDRPDSTVDGTKAEQVAKAVARKNALVADFDKLWSQIYAKAGFGELPAKPVHKITPNNQGHAVHTGFDSPGLVEDVARTGSMGLSTFFKGTSLEDANVLLWNERAASGDMLLRGEARVRTSVREKVNEWLKDRAVTTAGETVSDKFFPEPKGFKAYYEVILKAAKHVSYHSASKDFNQTYLDAMADVQTKLQAKLDELTPVLASGDQDAIDQLSLTQGDVRATVAAAKLYLDNIAKVHDLMAKGAKSNPGDIPVFVYKPRSKPAAMLAGVPEDPPVKVELVSASRASGQLGEDNVLQQDGSTFTSGNSGKMYLVTLPTGEQIEFRHKDNGVPLASHGLLRFTVSVGEGEPDATASLGRVKAQLAEMGLPLEEADEDDMELFYWRHLAGVMAERNDSRPPEFGGGKTLNAYATFWSTLQGKAKAAGAEMPTVTVDYAGSGAHKQYDLTHLSTLFPSPAQELEVWRSSFAALSTKSEIQKFVDGKGYLPSFSHQNLNDAQAATGRPYWERFDVSDEEWKSSQMLSSGLSNHSHALSIVKTGGAYSTEARIRLLGYFQAGMSSTDDQAYGSSQQVYTRQNKEDEGVGYQLWYSPKAIRRTSTYSYNSDLYGKLSQKHASAPFSFNKIKGQKVSNNETNVKESISLLDDIEIVVFHDDALRKQAIDFLASKGITEIRGVAVEDRLITSTDKNAFEAAKAKVKAAW